MSRTAPKVLIVEDERIVASDLQLSLNEMGYDAFATAASADEALACAAAQCPDIVLMDIRIKGASDGIQTAAILKERFAIGIIYLTAHSDAGMIDRAKRTDPHGYLLKPVNLAELGSMIEVVLRRQEVERELRKAHRKTRELAQRLAAVREEEQRAVAVRLHDGIAQDLFAMKLDLGRLEAVTKRQLGSKEIFEEISAALTACMESTRQVANDLHPTALARFAVTDVIAGHARHFEKRSGLKIEITHTASFPRLAESRQLLLFRAAQEALTNVARHAQATTVEISLKIDGERISMEVTDDGIGIAPDALDKPGSLGLFALRERFAALGGDLTIRRAQPAGTSMIVHLPRTPDDE
ncbi:MAG: response regulator [Steroidobacteraceae bacterium]|jgi:signal transduction histidine kinase